MAAEAWRKKRTPIKAKLTRFRNQFAAYDTTLGIGTWPIQLLKIEPLYEQFDKIQTEIEMAIEANDELQESRERNEFETAYFDIVSRVREFIERTQQRNASTSNVRMESPLAGELPAQASSVAELATLLSANAFAPNLPTIKIPTFDGSYKDWVKFRDSYKTMVHDKVGLSNIQKFHYLNDALSGDAARVIQSLGVSDANYDLAWKSLLDRFEDERSLIHFHLSSLFNLPVLTKGTFVALRQLIDDTSNNLMALKSLGEDTDAWDTVIIHMLTTKLDFVTKREWEKRMLSMNGRPTFREMLTFLENHCKYLQRVATDKTETNQGNDQRKLGTKSSNSKPSERRTSHATTKILCPLCQESHAIYHCKKLLELPAESRIDEVRKLRLCFNCLSPGHQNRQCKSGPCNKCPKKHNSLLHLDYERTPQKQDNEQSQTPNVQGESATNQSNKTALVSNLTLSPENEDIMLGTAIVWVEDNVGKRHECRVLLDSCSQVHLMTQRLSKLLKLPVANSNTLVSGVFKSIQEPQHYTSVNVISRSTNYSKRINCLITPEITEDMPNLPVHRSDFEIPNGLVLADPAFDKTRPVDLLLGAGIFWKLMCVGQIHLRSDQPILQKTQLGWIVAGPMQIPSRNRQAVCNLITNQQLHNELQRFWEIENHRVKRSYPDLDVQDDIEKHFISTTKRDEDGRFVVTIPLNDKVKDLGESLSIAHKRFSYLERKLVRNPELREKYIDFLDDYEIQGHMEVIPENEIYDGEIIHYLPHHAVFKDGSTTTKVRVVFDGSAKTSTGISFNEIQKVGPVVQNDLLSITLRFRQHPIVLSADIAQMYRQIRVDKKQQELQRILWRKNPSLPICHYRLKTVTYGTASAPYLATRVLRQIGEENKNEYPLASEIIIRDFYVDDLLTGASSIEEARHLRENITNLLSRAGFELRKWASNEPNVFCESPYSSTERVIQADKDPKTLGLIWNPDRDELKYSVKDNTTQRVTKRTILSTIAKIFDPLGLVGPVIIRAKIILQRLWELQLDWDETLPQDVHTLWMDFNNQLKALNEVSVPRFVSCKNQIQVQLHGFCDASEAAYGACIYIRSTGESDQSTVNLLCAKSKVAPLKKISLPRLELQAALLLAQLADTVNASMELKIDERYFWSDSTITLDWIKSSPNRWPTFVANRTSEIQTLTNDNWNHVRSEDNPADLISRGINPEDLSNNKLWWSGPAWLVQPTQAWLVTVNSSEKQKCEHSLIVTKNEDFKLLERYSSLSKLINVTAYCLRFILSVKTRRELRLVGYLTVAEKEKSLTCLLRLAQTQEFPCEVKDLVNSKQVSGKSKLVSLNPFIDRCGLLRVGGRLVNAPIPFEHRHPVILAPKNPLSRLIIIHEHVRLMHAGCQAVVASLRTRYWILSCKTTVTNIIKKCIRCFRVQPVTPEYIMGNLPPSRVTPQRPFLTCGVDYAGPYYIIDKLRGRNVTKAYICIFVCFVTKAVHIELARDLSTNAFLNCLYRFVSRRGKCQKIYSDNGTNFVGARNELRELGQLLTQRDFQATVTEFLANEKIAWHMIPANSPHFGGLWEAAVKSAKRHLRRVIGDMRLLYEELYTVLTQVEACLNSRPLTPISNDPNDLTPLTPGHFLIGDSLMAVPQHDLRDTPQNRLTRYGHLQFMFQHFWQRWQNEYLGQLQKRNKWVQSKDPQLVPGAMVIVRDDNLPPLKWRLGRIEKIHPGKDNVNRVVSVKVSDSTITRSVAKICPLPIDEELIENPH